MANNVIEQLIEVIRDAGPFPLYLDESIDVGNLAKLMVYVRFMFQNKPKEKFFFAKICRERQLLLTYSNY